MTRKPEIRVMRDGRVILSGKAYHLMRVKLCGLAGGICECGCRRYAPLEIGEVHHPNGRGGGRRDDRIFVDGKRNLYWRYPDCHRGKDSDHHKKAVPAKPTEAEFKDLLGL